jgi:hypothetical protein
VEKSADTNQLRDQNVRELGRTLSVDRVKLSVERHIFQQHRSFDDILLRQRNFKDRRV